MEILVDNINCMIDTVNRSIEFNDTVVGINKARILGSSDQCYRVMYMVAQYFNVKKVLEIGTHQGASAITFCQAIKDNNRVPEVHTVDNWTLQYKKIAQSNIDKSGFTDYIKMYDGASLIEVPKVLSNIGKVDIAFIDGKHTLDYIIGDYNNCKDFSDMILFHDTEHGLTLGEESYFDTVRSDGYEIYNFKTKYVEGDSHLVGIALAIKHR
jgi:hypothetical protein